VRKNHSQFLIKIKSMKEKGKMYVSGGCVVLCTGPGKSEAFFSGVVVQQDDPISDHQLSSYCDGWVSVVFNKEYEKHVVLDNMRWKERVEIGNCPG
jgi:hypothetical protein